MNHRHVPHLFAAYPGWEITPDTTPELAAAVKKSLALRGDEATGWSNAWKVNLYARLRDGDHALKILNEQLRLAASDSTDYHGEGGGTYSNMFDAHPPSRSMETSAAPPASTRCCCKVTSATATNRVARRIAI